ncbi:hypothetical protein GIB67_008997 [Kingdonia uniflora]|uniref:Uncharacterized protein n=1 Tax=Kingdonia uniflora TaxID=39325 RepID=A0A7J7LVL5_9MAGN|nr:hypothetical protein GIB67_008997 [Kingdonia uniflora]
MTKRALMLGHQGPPLMDYLQGIVMSSPRPKGRLGDIVSQCGPLCRYQQRKAVFSSNIHRSDFTLSLNVNYGAKKYKTALLQHRDLLEKLFDDLFVTGDFAWSSGMISVPPSTQQTKYVPLLDDINVEDTQVPLVGVDYPWEGEAIPSYDVSISPRREPTPCSTSPTPLSQVGVRTQSKGKRSAVAVQPLEPIELVLQNMVSSYEIDNTLFFKSLKFLEGSNERTYRLMLLRLRPEQRAGFLEALMS